MESGPLVMEKGNRKDELLSSQEKRINKYLYSQISNLEM